MYEVGKEYQWNSTDPDVAFANGERTTVIEDLGPYQNEDTGEIRNMWGVSTLDAQGYNLTALDGELIEINTKTPEMA
jgi:hypothetical protein